MDPVRLADPAFKAVRIIVRGQLDSAVEASARLLATADPEALHDVRVSMRRLRVVLKAYAAELEPGVSKGFGKALSVLARRTTSARDAEVFIDWLGPRIRRLPASRQAAGRWLLHQVEARRDAAYRMLRRLVPRALAMIEPLLRAGLTVPPSRGGPDRTFRARATRAITKQIEQLVEALDGIKKPDDDEAAHEARIAAKKVRYLLEDAVSDRGSTVVKPLKKLQGSLGDLHDLAGVKAQVERARKARSRDPDLASTPARLAALPGVLALAAREHRALFNGIRREFLDPPRAWLRPISGWIRRHQPPKSEASGVATPVARKAPPR